MRYIPHHKMNGRPHVMIDGAAIAGTALTLSHWPKSGTPWPLKADLSAEIVFNYLKKPEFYVEAEAATNTHFDTDGLVGIWAALNPQEALKQEAFLAEIAKAGDFGCFSDWQAWRVSRVLEAHAERATSPLAPETFEGSYAQSSGKIYEALLGLLPEIMREPAKFEKYWAADEAGLKEAEAGLRSGKFGHREDAGLGLAIFDFQQGTRLTDFPQFALHRATDCMGILLAAPGNYRYYDRYETWVQFVSRPLRPRIDLRPLAETLSALEPSGARWEADGPDALAPALRLANGVSSGLGQDAVEQALKEALASGEPAFDPFDPR